MEIDTIQDSVFVPGKTGEDHWLRMDALTGVPGRPDDAGKGPQNDGLLSGHPTVVQVPLTPSPKVPSTHSGSDGQETSQAALQLPAALLQQLEEDDTGKICRRDPTAGAGESPHDLDMSLSGWGGSLSGKDGARDLVPGRGIPEHKPTRVLGNQAGTAGLQGAPDRASCASPHKQHNSESLCQPTGGHQVQGARHRGKDDAAMGRKPPEVNKGDARGKVHEYGGRLAQQEGLGPDREAFWQIQGRFGRMDLFGTEQNRPLPKLVTKTGTQGEPRAIGKLILHSSLSGGYQWDAKFQHPPSVGGPKGA